MKQYMLRNILSLCNETSTQSMAERLAERHANVVAALQRIVPTILTGFTARLQETPETADTLMQLAGEVTRNNRGQRSPARISDEGTLQKGHEILQQLFGVYNVDTIGKQIARATMVRSSTALKLMQWAAPLCFGVIGKEAIENKFDAAMMSDWLKNESFEVDTEVPSWQVKTAMPVLQKTATKKVRDLSWLHFFVLLICGGVLFWILRS